MKNLLSRKSGPFYHEYEAFSEERRQIIIRTNLAKILEIASQTDFYRDQLNSVKWDVSDIHPLKNIAPLLSSDLRANLPPENSRLLSRPGTGYTVFQSGGTTGTPKTSLFSFEEMELINEGNARGFYAVGLNEQDRVANLWAAGGLYMTFIHMNRMLMDYGCMSFPFSNHTPVDFILEVAKVFNVNCFTGITSVVLNCLREIHTVAPGTLNVDKIFFGGEHIYEADRREMNQKFGVKVINAPGYGTVDSWYLGYQCSHLSNGMFHAFDDMVYIEIVNEEEKKHCVPGEIGMLLATPYFRTLTPIIRYRVGDRARWLKTACTCGRTTPLFELLGRGDDVLRIGYDSVDYDFVQEVVSRVPGASGRIQMQKCRLDGRDLLTIRVETSQPVSEYSTMSKILEDIFDFERPSFREFVKKGTVLPLKVEWLLEGQLPRNERTGKLIRVVDSL
ncbi:MAG: hypothetical protein SGJ18_14440 [Pseudomonadota bacterium]|nr:hypothetical protein [Pseudomonadota bacterium]